MATTEPKSSFSLPLKFLAAFALVILVGAATLSLLANSAAEREVRGFLLRGGMTDSQRLADRLGAYYAGRGTWDGVGTLLEAASQVTPGAGGMGRGLMQGRLHALSLAVYDRAGDLVFSQGDPAGPRLDAQGRAAATPILSRGRLDGYLVVPVPGADAGVVELLAGVNRAIWLSALAASVTALALGGVLVLGLLRPVRELTAAARAMARGARGQRVPVRSTDEIGELATAFNTMAERIDHGEALRREMTSDIAHELRQPLTVLRGRTEGMLDGVYPPDEDNLRRMEAQVRQLERLVEDLRVLALADAGQLPLHPAEVDLARLLGDTIDSLQPAVDGPRPRLEFSAEPGSDLRAILDPVRLQEIVANLVANALRHSPEDSAVEIQLRREGGGARVDVLDRGPGIPDAELSNIFERFYRLQADRSRGSGGSGLGLAIARKLAEAMGGRLEAGNREGGGAAFTLRLALAEGKPIAGSR
jgi:signal transduction histidine kinase